MCCERLLKATEPCQPAKLFEKFWPPPLNKDSMIVGKYEFDPPKAKSWASMGSESIKNSCSCFVHFWSEWSIKFNPRLPSGLGEILITFSKSVNQRFCFTSTRSHAPTAPFARLPFLESRVNTSHRSLLTIVPLCVAWPMATSCHLSKSLTNTNFVCLSGVFFYVFSLDQVLVSIGIMWC